jgi:hypothetical protein
MFPLSANSLVLEKPNSALKSHETLEISKVEITPERTIFNLTIENRIEGGNFCADKNIFMILPDGSRLKLKKVTNIPVCPDSYKFKSIGEKLQFSLEFPSLKQGIKWVDIVEECDGNCFWLYGITLDNDLNKRLDDAFELASKSKPADNVVLFRSILDDIDSQNLGIEGLLYINIINAAAEDGDKVNATVWYKRLASSHAPRVNEYIKYLNDRGIGY